MVAVRRIKHLVQLSAAGLLVLTLLIFIQWDDISYNARFKRFGLREHQELLNDEELTALERELDVDLVLKKIQNNVLSRLKHEEDKENNETQKEILRNLQQQHGNDSEDSTSTSFPSATNPLTDPVVQEATPISKPTTDKSRDLKNSNKKASREREHRRHAKTFKWKTYPWQPQMLGQLNVHVWQAWCGNTIHDLRRNWFFPSYPDLYLTVRRFFVKHYEDDYGQRIFGYIHPPLTGKYIFALSSDDTSEVWLSSDENPENVKLLSWVGNLTSIGGSYKTNIAEFTKYSTQLSRQIYLKKGQKYFIEALHKQGTRHDHILVGWKIPGLSGFRYITGDSISMYIQDGASTDVTEYAQYVPQTLPSHTHSHIWSVVLDREVHKFGSKDEPDIEYHNRKVELKSFDNILPNCTYEPSYLVNFTLRRYEGVKLIHDSAVYPNDYTVLTHMKPYDKCLGRRLTDSHGNSLHVTNPKITNHTIYEEGLIKVFGEGSVVTTSSDLSENYPIESFLEGDSVDGRSSVNPMSRLEEQKHIVSEIYNDTNEISPNQDEAMENKRNSYYGKKDQIEAINSQIRGAISSLSNLRRPTTNDVIPTKDRGKNDIVPKHEKPRKDQGKNDIVPTRERPRNDRGKNDIVPKRADEPHERQPVSNHKISRRTAQTIKNKEIEQKNLGKRKTSHKQATRSKRSSEKSHVETMKKKTQRKDPSKMQLDKVRKDSPRITASQVLQRKPVSQDLQRKPVSQDLRRKPVSQDLNRKPVSQVLQRKPVSQDLQRKPVSQDLRRKPVSQHLHRKPVSQHFQQKPVSQHLHRKPVSQHFQQKPVSQHLHRKPVSQVLQRKPVSQDFQQKPVSQDLHRKPVSQVLQRKPVNQVLQRKPVSQVLQRKPVSQDLQQKPVSQDLQRKPVSQNVQRKPVNHDFQRKLVNQDSYRSRGNEVLRANDRRNDDQRTNQIQPKERGLNTATLRKLMSYSKNDQQRNQVQTRSQSAVHVDQETNVISDDDEEDDDVDDDDDDNNDDGMTEQDIDDLDDLDDVDEDEDDEEEQIQSAKRNQDPVPVVNFHPRGTAQLTSTLPKFIYEDNMLSRLNNAHEYVRRMQRVVQAYQYSMTGKQLSDQIYRRYGIRITVPGISPYMNYNPWIFHHNTTKCTTDGNILLNEDVAKSVTSRYMEELEKKIPKTYTLERIIHIQENHDVMKGDRYLMELELFDHKQRKSVRLSQYVYQKIGQTHFCLPYNFQIKHHATVHVIVPVKNQGRWVQYFIDDMSELYLKTRDPHLNVIIVDFSSNDIDVEEAFKRSALVRYKVITLTGPFQRAFGIQAGAAVVRNENDIIFMCDLHLEIPNNMISIIRKHCIKGKMAFAPIVTRLHCGFTPTIPYGFWELQGYGLFALYKSDFNRVGGMNYREFGTRWGGEDWELLDRVLLHKMEVERLRIPNFYHFYHSKKGMWGSPTIDTVSSDVPAHYRNKKQIIPLYVYRVPKMVSSSSRPTYPNNRQRHLRGRRSPSRIVRPASRIRRGYRPRRVVNSPRPVPKEIY